ncbi:hypothetical protein GCM10011575_47700 [Microlunatus endophyticus]|uniref:Uncharacterized protein n=1 Tax=Microlunatus endophyticus TaxID=1716077 RepID=A0A917SID0_9ACTN|nr:hypothetical protein [Microlunatus endophyticus]GGL83883.1 hypothetical protein GCM10011575_47700 [Microlunatus endophyticus]
MRAQDSTATRLGLGRVQELTATRIATMCKAGAVIHGDPTTLRPPADYHAAADAAFDDPTTISIPTMVSGLTALIEAAAAVKSPATRTMLLGYARASVLITELVRRGKRRLRQASR